MSSLTFVVSLISYLFSHYKQIRPKRITPKIGPKRPTFEIGPKRPAQTGPKRLTPEIGPKRPGPKRPDRTGIGPKRPGFNATSSNHDQTNA